MKLHDGVPYVRAKVNGRGPFTFVVDTGTSLEAIVSPAMVKALNLPIVGDAVLGDLAGKDHSSVPEVAVDTISVAGHEFSAVRAFVHQPLKTIASYDGVLGFPLFREVLLTLAYPDRCLEVAENEAAAGAEGIPFEMPRGVPIVLLTVGRQQVRALVDSGGTGLIVPGSAAGEVEFAPHTEVLMHANTQVGTFYLRGGTMTGHVMLGAFAFRNPFLEISALLPMAQIGSDVLNDYALTFDQRGRRMSIVAGKQTQHVERPLLRAGVKEPGVNKAERAAAGN